MKCTKCNAELKDDSKFCEICGAEVPDTVERLENKVVEESKKGASNAPSKVSSLNLNEMKKDKSKLFFVVGNALILIGLARVMSAGTTISSTSFGGDFYTYSYQAMVAISEILASIEASIGWVIVALGVLIDVIALKK